MDIAKNTPTTEATIQGVKVNIPEPFVEGHTCTAAEASALNQVLKENVRNNLSGQVKKLDEAEQTSEHVQTLVDNYLPEYEFGVRRSGGGGVALSPQDKAARDIAQKMVKDALKQKGYTIQGEGENAVGREKYNELVEQFAAKEEIQAEAKRRVDAANEISIESLGF